MGREKEDKTCFGRRNWVEGKGFGGKLSWKVGWYWVGKGNETCTNRMNNERHDMIMMGYARLHREAIMTVQSKQ